MYNYCFLVGRLIREPKLNQTESGKNVTTLALAVDRAFKNAQTNQNDVDFIQASLWEPLVDSVIDYLHKGDTIGVKGRLQSRREEQNGVIYYTQELVAERVIFLSSNKSSED